MVKVNKNVTIQVNSKNEHSLSFFGSLKEVSGLIPVISAKSREIHSISSLVLCFLHKSFYGHIQDSFEIAFYPHMKQFPFPLSLMEAAYQMWEIEGYFYARSDFCVLLALLFA